MGKKDKMVSDPAVMEKIIGQSLFCRLAMSRDNESYVIPLCFGKIGDTLFFHTGLRGKKMDWLAQNPRVGFEISAEAAVKPAPAGESACSFSILFASVVGAGTARRVTEEEEKRKALDAIVSRYADGPFSYRPEALDATALLAVDITEMTGKISHLGEKYGLPAGKA